MRRIFAWGSVLFAAGLAFYLPDVLALARYARAPCAGSECAAPSAWGVVVGAGIAAMGAGLVALGAANRRGWPRGALRLAAQGSSLAVIGLSGVGWLAAVRSPAPAWVPTLLVAGLGIALVAAGARRAARAAKLEGGDPPTPPR